MYKCDFHLHTIATERDADFVFTNSRFKEYVTNSKLDCVAITNHNVFNRTQYEELVEDNPEIVILPGIEINVQGGHLIVIANPTKIDEFESKVLGYAELNTNITKVIKAEEILTKFESDDYLLIPHYDKKDSLNEIELAKYGDSIFVGEVSNIARFYRMKNRDGENLTPWLSSDYRVKDDGYINYANSTYLDVASLRFDLIIEALKLKRVYSHKDKIELIEMLDPPIIMHPSLNVLLGGRSSGKTHLLDNLYEVSNKENVKYIRQFSLLEKLSSDEEEKQKDFEKKLHKDFLSKTNEHKKSFRNLIDFVSIIDLKEIDNNFNKYCKSIIEFAETSYAHDSFTKHPIFKYIRIEPNNPKYLKKLIGYALKIYGDETYKEIFDKHLNKQAFKLYIKDLCNELTLMEKENLVIDSLNDVVENIKTNFEEINNIKPIEDFNVFEYGKTKLTVNKFEKACLAYTKEKVIFEQQISSKFKVIGNKSKATTHNQIQTLNSRKQAAYSEGATLLSENKFYDFLQWAKEHQSIELNNIYNLFVNINFKLLNEYNLPVSGGERAEYNLLKDLEDASDFEMLLIDEPESSFDNIFLNKFFNIKIQELAKTMPVIVATHNNAIGASLNPNFYLFTKRDIISGEPEFSIYFGKSGIDVFTDQSGEQIKSYETLLDQLEAGEIEYEERRIYYEKFKD